MVRKGQPKQLPEQAAPRPVFVQAASPKAQGPGSLSDTECCIEHTYTCTHAHAHTHTYTHTHLGGTELVALDASALHNGACYAAVIQAGVTQEVRGERPEVVHKIWVRPLCWEACAADAHSLQHTCRQATQSTKLTLWPLCRTATAAQLMRTPSCTPAGGGYVKREFL
eukprot:1139462-Pelagomonas_calceolata.AAC.2